MLLNFRVFGVVLLATCTLQLTAQTLKAYEQDLPGSSVKFKMVPIPAGTYMIGSPSTEAGREEDEGPQKKVAISAFWMAEHEVTFAEWDAFFKSVDVPQTKAIAVDAVSRPTAQYIDLTWGMGRDGKQPTNSMSQAATIMYCKWLYTKTGIFYRLPTEAEWEYGCRAGATAAYSFDNSPERLKEYAYFKDNSENKFQKVGQLKPNAWGLYDMLGNLSEWTLDQYDPAAYQNLLIMLRIHGLLQLRGTPVLCGAALIWPMQKNVDALIEFRHWQTGTNAIHRFLKAAGGLRTA